MSALLLDYGLTLVTYSRPHAALRQGFLRIAALLSAESGHPPAEALIEQLHDRVEAEVRDHAGGSAARELDMARLYGEAYAEMGLPLSDALLDEVMRIEQEAWWQGMRVGPGVIGTLHRLRASGLRVGLCSNAPYRVASLRGQLEYLGLAPCLDSATFSAEVGWRKPSPALFMAALRALGTSAEATVMVGDAVREDVGGARGAGLRVIRSREFHDDPDRSVEPDLVIDRFSDLPSALGLSNACS
ncbi:MAG: hypothetical protein NVSMB29_04150 [Candidatus Dormibacteria bacterium]